MTQYVEDPNVAKKEKKTEISAENEENTEDPIK